MDNGAIVWVLEESEGYEHRAVRAVYSTKEAGVRAAELAASKPSQYGGYERTDQPDGSIEWLDPKDWYRYHLTGFPLLSGTD